MSPAVSIVDLTKFYGRRLGVRDVTFEVAEGEVLGFLGPNGAGKTTVIRMLLGLISIDSGTAAILGQPVDPRGHRIRRDVGYLPGTVLLVVLGCFGVSLGVGARLLDRDIALARFLTTVVVLALLGAMVGSNAALVGSLTGRRTVALGASVGLFTALFVLYSLAPLVTGIERINPFNPVQWTLGATPLTTSFDLGDAVACVAVATVQCAAAAWFFARRDIAN